MCGVAGFIADIGDDQGQQILHSMSALLKHRGPDSQNQKLINLGQGQKLGLAHSLLRIIGSPGEGRQPFEVPGGVLVFNGAIYNYIALAVKLRADGVNIRTTTDTEVLAHGLATHGISFLNEVRGMFAFAFWDTRKRVLLLGRDPFGVKPLYIFSRKNVCCFASEYKALLPHLPDLSINESSVYSYLKLRYVPGHETLISGIKKIPQGTVLVIDPSSGSQSVIRYYSAPATYEPATPENLFTTLRTAIARRGIADVEVGALLSGGIDSGIVCDLLQISVKSLHTYTLQMDDSTLDESAKAEQISKNIGTIHTTIRQKHTTLLELGKLVYHLDDPYGDPIILALNRIFSSISGKQRVIVTGEGADEIFSGYVHHRAAGFLDRIPNSLLSLFAVALNLTPPKMLSLLLPYAGKMSPADLKQALTRMSRLVVGRDLSAFQSIFYLFDTSQLNENLEEVALVPFSGQGLKAIRDWDLSNWLPDSQLFKLDKLSMASSIEAREPFVDVDLVNAVNSLPVRQNFSLTSDKPLLRKAIEHRVRLPGGVVRSRKSSFFQPFNIRASGNLPAELGELVKSHSEFLHQFVKADTLVNTLTSKDEGLLSQKRLFALGILGLWKDNVWSQRSKGILLGAH